MLGETFDLSFLKVGDAYSRRELATRGGVRIPSMKREGIWSSGIERFENAVLLMVTLEKKEYAYRDYFDGSLFWWQSQMEQHRRSPVILQLVNGERPAHLFVRLRGKDEDYSAQSFVYAGRLSAPDVEGDKP